MGLFNITKMTKKKLPSQGQRGEGGGVVINLETT